MSVLLERESLLKSLDATLAEMLGGRGRLIFLGGEAGAGKSSLVSQFAADAESRVRVLRGFCDGGSTPRPLGPLVDIAASLGSVQQELGQESPRRHRLFPSARAALGAEPTLLVVEDAHWADEATVDFIRFLGRRLTDLRLLVVVTFRDDEVRAGHPLALVMGDLAAASSVARMQVPLLSVQGVARLVHDTGSALDAGKVHERTGGNPFFVTEILSTDTGQLPPSVRDAVLARAARLSSHGRAVLGAASVIGHRAEIPLLIVASGETAAAVDECIELGVLLDAGDHVSFRHELAREVIEEAMPSASRQQMHRAVFDYLVAHGVSDHRRLAYHAQGCGDAAAVAEHAPKAAEEAARLGSHREAAAHYRAALRHGLTSDESTRAQLLEALSYECYLT
ncbi:MAG TPA: AAA family ATPase, partial [Acidothermales bacterium]